MAHDVFLSHSSKDKELVDLICTRLEQEGIRCWMAPRDIRPGSSWGAAIVHAIRDAPVMVLVFSSHANTSPQIKREVERAVHFNSTVIPMRVENILPDDDLEYFLGMPHWLDAFTPPLEPHLELLARTVKEILKPDAAPLQPPLPRAPAVNPALNPPPPAAPAAPPKVHPPSVVPGIARNPPPLPAPVRPHSTPPPSPPPPFASPPTAPVPMATMLDAGTAYDRSIDTFQTITDTRGVGSFTTTLAGNATSRIGVTIPEPFLGAGVPGTILKLVPVEILRGRPPLEIYLTTRSEFTLGRSPEADLITIFFPRNEKNDLRSRRLSKIHARVDYRDDLFWVHRKAGASVHIGQQAIGDDPGGYKLRERDQLILAEDFALEIFFDISLRGTLQFNNAEAWRRGALEFSSVALGAVRFEPLNSTPSLRTSCWLFVDVGFGSARGGVITAGSELAPQQGVILYLSGCFWILNLVNNEKVAINDYRPAANELVPLGRNDSIWFGAVRYRAEIA